MWFVGMHIGLSAGLASIILQSQAFFINRFDTAQAKPAARTINSPTTVTFPSSVKTMIAIPEKAITMPTTWLKPGVSLKTIATSSTVKKAWLCRIIDAKPADRPICMSTNSNANLTTPRMSPIPQIYRQLVAGFGSKKISGNAANMKRSAENISGGKASMPMWITTKFNPQTKVIRTAKKISLGAMVPAFINGGAIASDFRA